MLCMVPLASADVVVHQVLYDPVSKESGGEAVELLNTGPETVDISGWLVATESSASDATIPQNTRLAPGEPYLIADRGWNESRDDPSWRAADHEEPITLSNGDGGVALVASGSTIDAIGWGDKEGIEEGLAEGTPAAKVQAGSALLRVQDTAENSEDVIEAAPDFFAGRPVFVSADVSLILPRIEVSPSLKLDPSGELTVTNHGDEPVHVTLHFNDLYFQDKRIPRSAIEVATTQFTVKAGEQYVLPVELTVPQDALPGVYQSTMRVHIE